MLANFHVLAAMASGSGPSLASWGQSAPSSSATPLNGLNFGLDDLTGFHVTGLDVLGLDWT